MFTAISSFNYALIDQGDQGCKKMLIRWYAGTIQRLFTGSPHFVSVRVDGIVS